MDSPLVDDPLADLPPEAPLDPVRRAWAALRVALSDAVRDVSPERARELPREALFDLVDWEATEAQRRRADALGLGVAEAMDTAQRARIGWPLARHLIERTGALGLRVPFVAGAGADQLARPEEGGAAVVDAVVEQCAVIQGAGGIPILLPLACLVGADEETTVRTYGDIVRELAGPVLVHWLGAAFAPHLAGYFPGESFRRVLALEPGKVRGAKLSLLDTGLERRLRAELSARGQVLLTGDDLHFGELLEGDDGGAAPQDHADLGSLRVAVGPFSHALLGVLDAVARPAAAALAALARGDVDAFRARIGPCEDFGRLCFAEPVRVYRAGLAFVAWLGGLQPNACLFDREEAARDRDHYRRIADLAARAGAFEDLAGARERLAAWERDPGVAGHAPAP